MPSSAGSTTAVFRRVEPAEVREAALELIRRLELAEKVARESRASAVEQARKLAELADRAEFARLYHVIPQEARGIFEDLGPDHALDPEHVIDETRDLIELIDLAASERDDA